MTKPFEIDELVMRLKAILKRTDKIIEDKIIIQNFEINFSKSKVFNISPLTRGDV
jgi:DNA-binding response OmpR family regulator